jgi:hypothetical protein
MGACAVTTCVLAFVTLGGEKDEALATQTPAPAGR